MAPDHYPTGKLRSLAPEIEELRGFETPTGPDALLLVFDYRLRRDELMAKLEKLGIPPPTKEQFVILRSFLTVLYDCAMRGDVERAKVVLTELKPEVDARRDAEVAARLKALAPEIEELYDYDKTELEALAGENILEVHHYTQRCDELLTKLSKLGIPAPPRPKDFPALSRWRKFLLTLYGRAIRGNVKHARAVLKYLDAADQNLAEDGAEAESDAPPADA